jgi:hypothetical protein
MNKKYIVRLTAKERRELGEVVKKLAGSSQKVRRAQMLLKADVAGPGWTDERIAEAFDSRTRTVEKLRERFVTEGFASTLDGKPRDKPPTAKILSGKQEARVIALRLGPPPQGYANWTLRLLARRVVELEIVESISHETVRRTLKKRDDQPQDPVLGHSSAGRRGVRRRDGSRARHL